jgi:hypothetical protein
VLRISLYLLGSLLFGVIPDSVAAQDSWFYVQRGRCELPFDPAKDPNPHLMLPLGMCANAYANQSLLYSSELYFADTRRAEGQLSLHAGAYQSLYFGGFVERIASAREDKIPTHVEKDLREASYTLGNVTLFPLSVTVGKQSPVFGINHSPITTINPLFSSRALWSRANPGAIIRLDNIRRWSFETSINQHSARDDKPEDKTLAARYMYDLPFKLGVRTVFSFQGKESGERKAGIGFLSISPRGNIFQIEWVRSRSTPDGKQDPFEQIIRISFEESPFEVSSAYLMFEEIRLVARQMTLGSRWRMWEHVQTLSSITYQKPQESKQEWFLSLGLGVVL